MRTFSDGRVDTKMIGRIARTVRRLGRLRGRLGERVADLLAAARCRIGAPVAELAEQRRLSAAPARAAGAGCCGAGACLARWRFRPALLSFGRLCARRSRRADRPPPRAQAALIGTRFSSIIGPPAQRPGSHRNTGGNRQCEGTAASASWSFRPRDGAVAGTLSWVRSVHPEHEVPMKAMLCTRFGGPDDLEYRRPSRSRAGRGRGRRRHQGGGAQLLRHADHRREIPVQAAVPVLAGVRIRRRGGERRRGRERIRAGRPRARLWRLRRGAREDRDHARSAS